MGINTDKPIFEAKYIAIKWADENTVLKIEEAVFPISVQIESNTIYNMELQIYKRISNGLNGQIGFHILDPENKIEPYFIDASGKSVPLVKIIDPQNNKAWWIESGKWLEKHKCKSYYLWNHVGDTKVIFGDITCNITVRANSFTRNELNLYLNDFKNDFWYLILQNDSITQGEAKSKKVKLLNNDTIKLISEFIKYAENVLSNPKKELKEIQKPKDIKLVKPVAKTFMEIATSGFKKKLTSRDTIESYNVAENRFVHYTIERVYTIVFNMLNASNHIKKIYMKRYDLEQQRLNSFTDKIIIDKEVLENEILDLKEKIRNDTENLKNSISQQNIELKGKLQQEINNQLNLTNIIKNAMNSQNIINIPNYLNKFIIKLENRQQDYNNKIQFWGKIKKYGAKEWEHFGNNDSLSLEFNKELFSFLSPNQEYIITAANIYKTKNKKKVGIIHKIFFNYIAELKPLLNDLLEYKTIYVQLHSKQDDYKNKIQFWGKCKNNTTDNWKDLGNNNSLSLEFDKNIFDSVLKKSNEYKISGYIRKSEKLKQNGGKIYKIFFEYITDIELLKSSDKKKLEYLEYQKRELKISNWQRKLTKKEKEEQDREKRALQKSIKLLKEQNTNTIELLNDLTPKLKTLKKLLQQFKDLKIKKDSYFPNSMTFVQNPNYQGVHKYYQKIKNSIGVDESLFVLLQVVEKIGILDIPNIYERWCLLQIIKVLMNEYRFLPEENWKVKLASQILNNSNSMKKRIKDVKIKFTNSNISRDIDLWYEYELKNKRRPDFVLDIKSTITNNRHRLVMDAKFHENVDIKCLINSLYPELNQEKISELDKSCPKENNKIVNKNYSENGKNTVFILHPDTKKPIKNRKVPNEWGDTSYYGEIDMFSYAWDKDDYPNHKYGAILLSPIKNSTYLDSLKRVIGLAIQYNSENNEVETKDSMLDPYTEEKPFCLQCGSHKIRLINKGIARSRKGYYYDMVCEECQHHMVYFYCWNCKYRLIKNGVYWSYHAFSATNPYDIRCPHCSEYWYNEQENLQNNQVVIEENITKKVPRNKTVEYFENYEDAVNYIKNNPGTSCIRNSNGTGWIVKL